MASKIKYYDISNLLSTGAQYLMLLGQRANGKSYQAKYIALRDAYKAGVRFVYLRRWKEDIKQKSVQAYFDDMPVSKITDGNWDAVKAYNGEIYFTVKENGEEVKSQSIGRYCALNEAERYKSWVFNDYVYIIYEEFITDKFYLPDEPRILQQFISTVARHREMTVMLIGNTLSRVCPYFTEWCLDGVLKQKQGTIELYHYHTDDNGTIDIAVEYCVNANAENKMFFGTSAKQIVSGEWDVQEVPKLPRKQSEYEKVYEVLYNYTKFKFVIELLVEPLDGGVICFVYPYTGIRTIYRQLKDEFSDKPNITSKLDIGRRPEIMMRNCIVNNKVCYSDNLTGADFKNCMNAFPII